MMKAVNADDFFVEDEPLEAVEAAFAAGRPVITHRPATARVTGAKFEVKATKNGQFMFNLRAANGVVIATSEHYATKAAALRAIETVRATAADAEIESTLA